MLYKESLKVAFSKSPFLSTPDRNQCPWKVHGSEGGGGGADLGAGRRGAPRTTNSVSSSSGWRRASGFSFGTAPRFLLMAIWTLTFWLKLCGLSSLDAQKSNTFCRGVPTASTIGQARAREMDVLIGPPLEERNSYYTGPSFNKRGVGFSRGQLTS